MDERIFDPLGMTRTTFDFSEAMRANWARPHARGYDGPVESAPMDWNYMVHPYRPAGGAWSTAHDMALYAMNELREGTLANGTDLVSAENLLKRRERYVPIGEDAWYGMGLMEELPVQRLWRDSRLERPGTLLLCDSVRERAIHWLWRAAT